MGKRSRKRTAGSPGATTDAGQPAGGTTRAERDAARARRAAAVRQGPAPAHRRGAQGQRRSGRAERPPAPWGRFPLVELLVLAAIVLLVVGFVTGGDQGLTLIFLGLALGSLGGLELSIREHFGGFRSHTTVLAGAVAIVVATVVAVAAGKIVLWLLLGVWAAAFGAAFYVFRRAFRKRTGGVSFR